MVVSFPRYGFTICSKAVMPKLSLMPYRVIMARAMEVACSMSLLAPVVTESKQSSSAARPPVSVTILAKASCLSIRKRSSSSACMVNPRAPEVRGMMVILCTGEAPFCLAATRAWPTSW